MAKNIAPDVCRFEGGGCDFYYKCVCSGAWMEK